MAHLGRTVTLPTPPPTRRRPAAAFRRMGCDPRLVAHTSDSSVVACWVMALTEAGSDVALIRTSPNAGQSGARRLAVCQTSSRLC